ncbi:MAG: HAD-IIIA family hydrolase [Cellvibrionales bacterium]|jgi:3-deoxy-D-manno-octulosonate 8-phosphate phosphatase (KDO 8-P phosphatase)
MAMATEAARRIKLAVFDVDGVMTDSRVTYTSDGSEQKSFNIKDGLGIKLLQRAGIKVAIITGRHSTMVERRAAELDISDIVMGREDKLQAMLELIGPMSIELDEVAYMGDDLPDLSAIMQCGLGACPSDAVLPVRQAADWVSATPGGHGAIREWAEAMLQARGQWVNLMASFQT